MGKTRVQTRVDHDTNEQIEAYRDDNNLSDAEAVRRLVRAGLAAKGHPVEAADGGHPIEKIASPRTVTVAGVFMLTGVLSLAGAAAASSLAVTVALTGLGAVLSTIATAATTAAAIAQMVLARPMIELVGLKRGVEA